MHERKKQAKIYIYKVWKKLSNSGRNGTRKYADMNVREEYEGFE
jgi:hypothetical protein